MINQVRLNTVMCHSWVFQNNALMSEVCDEYWDSEFLMIFNSESRIYNVNNRF